ncbi:MAG: amidohydrolase [Acidobacteriota bacterium]
MESFASPEGRLVPALRLLLVTILVLCSQHTTGAQLPSADLVVINANVRTMTGTNARAAAFSVSGNRITAVGTTNLIKTFIGPSTRVIDAGGRLVLPGFNDAHVHFMAIGNSFSSIDLRDVTSSSEMTVRIARYARFLSKGRWILGGHFNNVNWELPDRKAIDAITPDNPVFLYRSGATTAFANSLAFKLANVKDDAADVDRNAHAEPTGIVRGDVLKKIATTVPANHTKNWPAIGETATNYAASLGVTSVQDMHSDDSREIFRELERRGKLKTRVYDCVPLRDWKKLRDARLADAPGSMVRDGCLKSFSDGDDESKAGLLGEITAADKAGLQIMIHAIGNSANRSILDVFEKAENANGRRDRRFRVEHAHKVLFEDLPRFSRSGIVPSMQPFLFAGSDRSHYGTLLKLGAKVAFGSDASMVDLNPMLGIHAAANAGPESISVYEAVRAYTVGSAYAEFQEKEKGTIERGKLADFVILSDDIFTVDRKLLQNVKIVLTVVDGKAVYQAN